MILSSMPQLTIIPTHVEANQCTCHDVISRTLSHVPVAKGTFPKKVWPIYVYINYNARTNACA